MLYKNSKFLIAIPAEQKDNLEWILTTNLLSLEKKIFTKVQRYKRKKLSVSLYYIKAPELTMGFALTNPLKNSGKIIDKIDQVEGVQRQSLEDFLSQLYAKKTKRMQAVQEVFPNPRRISDSIRGFFSRANKKPVSGALKIEATDALASFKNGKYKSKLVIDAPVLRARSNNITLNLTASKYKETLGEIINFNNGSSFDIRRKAFLELLYGKLKNK